MLVDSRVLEESSWGQVAWWRGPNPPFSQSCSAFIAFTLLEFQVKTAFGGKKRGGFLLLRKELGSH